MGEQAKLIVLKLGTDTMKGLQSIERHVGREISSLRIMLKASEVQRVGCDDIQLALLADSSRIERSLHVEIMTDITSFSQHNNASGGSLLYSQSDQTQKPSHKGTAS